MANQWTKEEETDKDIDEVIDQGLGRLSEMDIKLGRLEERSKIVEKIFKKARESKAQLDNERAELYYNLAGEILEDK
jgi:proteasome assembly chaperone (PAC2) family protein